MTSDIDTSICVECGYPKDSQEHIRGVGLHDHISYTPEESDEQRRASFAKLVEFDPDHEFDADAQNLAYEMVEQMATYRYTKDLIKAGRGDEVMPVDHSLSQMELNQQVEPDHVAEPDEEAHKVEGDTETWVVTNPDVAEEATDAEASPPDDEPEKPSSGRKGKTS